MSANELDLDPTQPYPWPGNYSTTMPYSPENQSISPCEYTQNSHINDNEGDIEHELSLIEISMIGHNHDEYVQPNEVHSGFTPQSHYSSKTTTHSTPMTMKNTNFIGDFVPTSTWKSADNCASIVSGVSLRQLENKEIDTTPSLESSNSQSTPTPNNKNKSDLYPKSTQPRTPKPPPNKFHKFDCPSPGCKRIGNNGFKRWDNVTTHRRGVHDEDIPKMKARFEGKKKIRLVQVKTPRGRSKREWVRVDPE